MTKYISPKRQVYVIAHNIRSTHNVGALMRTAEGLGINKLYLTGYTPYPAVTNDHRLPHIAAKLSRQINKTALGAETSLDWQAEPDAFKLLQRLKKSGFEIAALEQTASSIAISDYQPPPKLALVIGSEIGGIDKDLLSLASVKIEIPMAGKKESFNVASAAAMALFYFKLLS